jgi:Fic family protein
MSNLINIKTQIAENQSKISEFGKFDQEVLKKINYKIRLDWNYYSSRMEGGTLTREETRSVMVGNIDVRGKPFKDVAEMAGHDKIVLEVLKMTKTETRISERRIRDIHLAIMHEEDPVKKAEIGNWKSGENEIISYKGEKISFAPPSEVAHKMHELLNDLNAKLDKYLKKKLTVDILDLVAQFHIDFVTIHPFYDGNGRTTRILTNIMLMIFDYPVIIIKEENKKAYYQLLGDIQAYGGKKDLFYEFIGERILDSQKLILNAIEGKNIDDIDDIDKEIELFKRKLIAKENIGVVKKSTELIVDLYNTRLKHFFDHILEKHKKLETLFSENNFNRRINNSHSSNFSPTDDYIQQQFNNLNILSTQYKDGINTIAIGIHHIGFLKDDLNSFDVHTNIYIKFDEFQFHIGDLHNPSVSFLYSNIPSNEEIIIIASDFMKDHLNEIKNKIKS